MSADWLAADLNRGRLDLFYLFLAFLMTVNTGVFVLVAAGYKYKSVRHVLDDVEGGMEPVFTPAVTHHSAQGSQEQLPAAKAEALALLDADDQRSDAQPRPVYGFATPESSPVPAPAPVAAAAAAPSAAAPSWGSPQAWAAASAAPPAAGAALPRQSSGAVSNVSAAGAGPRLSSGGALGGLAAQLRGLVTPPRDRMAQAVAASAVPQPRLGRHSEVQGDAGAGPSSGPTEEDEAMPLGMPLHRRKDRKKEIEDLFGRSLAVRTSEPKLPPHFF